MKLFSGTSNPSLAQKIAHQLKLPQGAIEITRFIDNECRAYVTEKINNDEVFENLDKVAAKIKSAFSPPSFF